MARQMIVISRAGGDREDGMIDYASYALVSSDTLNFDEPVFTDSQITRASLGEAVEEEEDEGHDFVYEEEVIAHIKALGYTIESTSVNILWLDRGE